MESTDKEAPESGKAGPEIPASAPPPAADCVAVELVLRILLLASTLVAVVVMATAKQTKVVPVLGVPFLAPVEAKFDQSPAFIYFIVALSVAGLYSIITILASFTVILKPIFPTALRSHFALMDVLMLGLVASATGAAGGVAYIGLKGNSHVNWAKVCDVYDKFCQHMGSAVVISLFASVLLVLLVLLSIYSLSRRIPRESC